MVSQRKPFPARGRIPRRRLDDLECRGGRLDRVRRVGRHHRHRRHQRGADRPVRPQARPRPGRPGRPVFARRGPGLLRHAADLAGLRGRAGRGRARPGRPDRARGDDREGRPPAPRARRDHRPAARRRPRPPNHFPPRPRAYGKTAWALPDDLWGTLIAAQRLAHLNLAGLYTYPTQLVSLPGAAIILIPAIAVIDPAGLQLTVPHAHGAYPSVWLFAGPYQVAISAVVLFAADAIAERLGATRPKRFWLAAASATALWSVTVRWGHPEDAVAIGLLLYAILALADAKAAKSAWLAGAAVAVQPLVLLAFPLLAAVIEPRRLPGYVAPAAAPGALLLAAAATANWNATG